MYVKIWSFWKVYEMVFQIQGGCSLHLYVGLCRVYYQKVYKAKKYNGKIRY